ncbi:Oidioi.mRNA.OKI2018_I69.XSR.g15948.t1.cds [Oikopleura dioica]|uniref:Oidioi.mRNA.OKI2018_I69.XSR.g15948.t1.cds n=1 Tax=Oikopleura dioica TaxID=34765 RepID=A0ABN7SEH7_OIKDI|nr:Oidioi.mRNA.OKI2018_I69.XSR.g15948.t1.cds [Oikopleura dioica]
MVFPQTSVPSHYITASVYDGVISDVMKACRDAFIEEGYDEASLLDVKRLWTRKLAETKAVTRQPGRQSQQQVVRQPQQIVRQPQQVYIQRQVSQDGRPIQRRQFTSNGQPVQYVQYRSNQSPNVQQSPQPQRIYVQRPQQVQTQYIVQQRPQHSQQQRQPQQQRIIVQNNRAQNLSPGPSHRASPNSNHVHQLDGTSDDKLELESEVTPAPSIEVPETKSAPANPPPIPTTLPESIRSLLDEDSEIIIQIDGVGDDVSSGSLSSSSSDDPDSDTEHVDEPALNSDDNCPSPGVDETFDCENILVCKYDKITRNKNQWKMQIKEGIMNIKGYDHVFWKALGDTPW